MVIFFLKIMPSVEQRREVLEILHHVEGPTSANLDCVACAVYERAGGDQAVCYLEQWKSIAAAHHHIQSPMFTKILAVMDMSTTQPEIQFHEVSQTWGLELIRTIRSQKAPVDSTIE